MHEICKKDRGFIQKNSVVGLIFIQKIRRIFRKIPFLALIYRRIFMKIF